MIPGKNSLYSCTQVVRKLLFNLKFVSKCILLYIASHKLICFSCHNLEGEQICGVHLFSGPNVVSADCSTTHSIPLSIPTRTHQALCAKGGAIHVQIASSNEYFNCASLTCPRWLRQLAGSARGNF